jgi:DNA-binding transcriptional MocR family regulator
MNRISNWTPKLDNADGPAYLAIANALAQSIRNGDLIAGDRLPPQRVLAAALGLDFTTVSRGYAEAQRRGLTEARVGQGTYVKPQPTSSTGRASYPAVDMMINHPPRFSDPALETRLWEDIPAALSSRGMEMLMRYQHPAGALHDRTIGTNWLSPRIPDLARERVLVCPGTQSALLVVSMMLARAGDAVCVEALCYPGFLLLAKELGLRLLPVEMDEHGAKPESLDAICRVERPKAFYCTPILHNPTAVTMPLERRVALVEVARRHGLPVIEDDNYWPLFASREYGVESEAKLPTLASLAPERVFYISGLAKCVSPALRIAYLAVPDFTAAERAAVVIRATTSMASPLNAAVASHWVESGIAQSVLEAIRVESHARQLIAQRYLDRELGAPLRQGFHLWLSLPKPWTRGAFAHQLRLGGISVAESDAFAVSDPPEAVRICLGGPETRADLERCLKQITDVLHHHSPSASLVI